MPTGKDSSHQSAKGRTDDRPVFFITEYRVELFHAFFQRASEIGRDHAGIFLREAARHVLTQELYERQKHPFVAPPLKQKATGALRDPLRERCEEIVRSPSFADQPFFDPKKVISYLDAAAKGDAQTATAASPIVLRLASFSLMQQRFGISS